jgi:hypothetical protein
MSYTPMYTFSAIVCHTYTRVNYCTSNRILHPKGEKAEKKQGVMFQKNIEVEAPKFPARIECSR